MSMTLMNAVSVASATNSSAMTLSLDTCVSFYVEWTGDTTGTLYLQVSNDSTNWVTTSEVFPANPAGSSSSTAEVWSGFGYKYARVRYVPSGGSGTRTMTVKAFSKRGV